ncbi:hypothetical protein [Streptomyces sp. ISL-86]|uniref:hypothetical protein n=1 Tax=Streptomyces sp. ISL-86 TaxID=2819187 RepID=UPI001BE7D136|nr:hypothetical protein [Streptomyces sp. ISL-86]MBT2454809.1 hypothetical protein [Streptomyces sp. ISL-86]
MGSGHPLPGAPASSARAALHTAGLELLSSVDNYLARPGLLGEEDLSRLCFVAAYFEDVFRSGQVRRFSPLATADGATGLGRLCAGVREYVVEDLARQMELAEGPFKDFRWLPDQARVCGPSFAGSTDIGGADADFILAGLLLDCKATTRPQRLGREEIYQLAGYLLLDYDDRYGIDQVGLYLSRQGHLISWHVNEFLARLGATAGLPKLRDHLRRHLRACARSTAAFSD